MIRPSSEVVHALAASVRQFPVLLDWVNGWRSHELDQLPHATTGTAVLQGRCQILAELAKLMNDAPELAAKPSSPSNHAHR